MEVKKLLFHNPSWHFPCQPRDLDQQYLIHKPPTFLSGFLWFSVLNRLCLYLLHDKVIQMVSAVDKDLPLVGQRFFFKSPKELRNRNFTVRDFGSK